MGDVTDGGSGESSKKRQVLGYRDFAEGVLEKIAEKAECSKAIAFRAFKLAYKFLKDYNLVDYSNDKTLIIDIAEWGEYWVIAICELLLSEGDVPKELILQEALADVLLKIYNTHVHRDFCNEQIERAERALADLKRAHRKIEEVEAEKADFLERAGIAKFTIEQQERIIKALKHQITAMTFAQIKEREALIKEFVGGQVGGEVFDPVVFKRNS